MFSAFSQQDAVELASSLRRQCIPWADEFIQNWMSFNALYSTCGDRYERDKVRAICAWMPEAEAQQILADVEPAIRYFVRLPPGDTRKPPTDPRFRVQSTDDLRIVSDLTASSTQRLANLASVLYTVRCSLLHGRKSPDRQRDVELVRESQHVLDRMLPPLIEAIR